MPNLCGHSRPKIKCVIRQLLLKTYGVTSNEWHWYLEFGLDVRQTLAVNYVRRYDNGFMQYLVLQTLSNALGISIQFLGGHMWTQTENSFC